MVVDMGLGGIDFDVDVGINDSCEEHPISRVIISMIIKIVI